jgi:hypothetical protein
MRSKAILYCVILSFLSWGGTCQQKRSAQLPNEKPVITKIEFTTLTRGHQKQVYFSPDSLIKITDGRQNDHQVVKRSLAEGQWQDLVNSLKHISLEEIPGLPSPTSRRAFDGAMHSSIVIWAKDEKSYIHAFDDEHPHEKLQPLMDLIKKTAGIDK